MLAVAMILLVLSTLLTIGIVYWYFTSRTTRKEGFLDSSEQPEQANIAQILGTIRRLSGNLMNMGLWTERMAFTKMTPTDLARMHLNKAD
jgi:flagellar basal body-associated protein FliL